jgi:hypothetical protein
MYSEIMIAHSILASQLSHLLKISYCANVDVFTIGPDLSCKAITELKSAPVYGM